MARIFSTSTVEKISTGISTRIANFYFDYKVFFYWGMAQGFAPCFFLCISIALLTMLFIGKWNTEMQVLKIIRKRSGDSYIKKSYLCIS